MNNIDIKELSKWVKELNVIDTRGHYIQKDGTHTPISIRSHLLYQRSDIVPKFALHLVLKFNQSFNIDTILTPALGGLEFATDVREQFFAMYKIKPKLMYSIPPATNLKLARGWKLQPGTNVFIIDDIVNTGSTLRMLQNLIIMKGAILKGIGLIFRRNANIVKNSFGKDVKIEWLLDLEADMGIKDIWYSPHECPLCKQGIPITPQWI